MQEIADLFEAEKRGSGPYRTAEEIPSAQEVAADEATMLMNRVACGEVATWDEIRPKLIELYAAAGCTDCSRFIEMSSTAL